MEDLQLLDFESDIERDNYRSVFCFLYKTNKYIMDLRVSGRENIKIDYYCMFGSVSENYGKKTGIKK